jgi:uncharacterized delta-60 repeat protein
VTRRRRSPRAEPLESRTLFAAPNITSIDTDGTAWKEGEYHFISGSFTDADANDRRTVVVDWGDGSAPNVEVKPAGVRGFSTNRHAYPDDETSTLGQPRRYTITVTVTDSTFQSDTETRQIEVRNVAPTARLPLDDWVTALEGSPVTIPGNVYDPGADTHTFHWRVMRGFSPDPAATVFESTARDLVFTPGDDGPYNVSLDVRDDDGGTRAAATKVWATNAPPNLTVFGVTESGEGQPYELELRATDAGADTIDHWTIDWGDGQVDTLPGNPPTAGHRYDGPGHYVVRATATDEDGTWGAAPFGVFWRAGDADRTFGPPATPGRVVTDFPLPVETDPYYDALQYPDGRRLVLRTTKNPNAVEGLSLARFRADGSFDGTFDGDGRLFLPGRWNLGLTLALQGDKILFAAVRSGGTYADALLDVFRLNPDGSPDATFGTGGVATVPIGVEHEGTIRRPEDLLVTPDGKIVVPTGAVGLFTSSMQVMRFNADGSPDASFGTGGRVEHAPPSPLITARAWSAQPASGGRLQVSGGGHTSDLVSYRFTVMLLPDGSVDPSFGTGGWQLTAGAAAADAAAPAADQTTDNRLAPWLFVSSAVRSLHVLPDGKILAIGQDPNEVYELLFMARYLPDGTPDLTFGDFGRVAQRIGLGGGISSVLVDSAGRILLARGGYVFRFNPDGSPDTAFNDAHPTFSPARHFALAPDGKIVGTNVRSDDGSLVVARFNADGSPDTTFGNAGRFEGFPGFGNYYTDVKAVAVQADGRIVVGGRGLVRLTASGAPDPTFGGGDGFVPASPLIPPGYEQYGRPNFVVARGVAVAPDGKILTTWGGNQDESLGGYAVARYLPDGTLDPGFATGGQGIYAGGIAERVALDPQGRILVGGFGSDADAYTARGYGNTALRLLPGGARDLSFGRDGVVAVATAGPGNDSFQNQMAVLGNGDVLLGGLDAAGRFVVSRFHGDDQRANSVDVWNTPPAANAGPDVKAITGRPVTLTATFADPSPSDGHTFHWKVTDVIGMTVAQGDGQSITFTPPTTQRYTATFTVADDDGAASSDSAFVDAAPAVVGRWLFYDNSAYDGHAPGPNRGDNDAVATDKRPLLPGGAAGFANVSGYSRGINGVMIDVAGGMPLTALVGVAMNVGLKMGTGGDPAAWPDAPRPTLISVFPGDGAGGSDRIVLTWPDGAIRNTWLRVTVRDVDFNGGFGLPDDTFVFGNLIGDAADAGALKVDAADVAATRAAGGRRVTITTAADHNRDGRVNALDQAIVRAAQGHKLSPVSIPIPAPAPSAAPPTPRRRPGARDVLSPQ